MVGRAARARLAVAAATLSACATANPPAPATTAAAPTAAKGATGAREGKTWADSVLATLSLRDKAAQMVWPWVLGDYTSYDDSTFAEVRRWIERDHIGGVSMSLGTPIEVAAKINNMQRLSRVPLMASADLEPGLGRLEGGVFSHYLLDAGSAKAPPEGSYLASPPHPPQQKGRV